MDLEAGIVISPPLDGEWRFLRPPGHHPFAFDFVKTGARKRAQHPGTQLKFYLSRVASRDFYCWDEPVRAPLDGTVIRVGSGWPDHEYANLWNMIRLWYNATYRFRPQMREGRLDIRPNAGNHVMIQAREGHVVFLAHLRNGSIVVSEGQEVHRREVVGRVGSSGNSTMPHLHMNLFDQMDDPYRAKVLPFVFDSFQSRDSKGQWVEESDCVPMVGTHIRFHSR
jgi:hypothetical protein